MHVEEVKLTERPLLDSWGTDMKMSWTSSTMVQSVSVIIVDLLSMLILISPDSLDVIFWEFARNKDRFVVGRTLNI